MSRKHTRFAKATNRIVKHVGRVAFGFRNPTTQRRRGTVGLHPPNTAGATHDQTTMSLQSRKSHIVCP
jgi:hypothetical protein